MDKLKAEGETLARTNPKSERLQPYKAQYMRLCKSYVDAMKAHQVSKEKMRQTQTDTLVRRGMIIYQDGKSESEIRDRVERDPAGFLAEAIMEEASAEAQQAYIDAQSRARDVEMLVRSINEVAAMFQDLAVLIQQQSEMLDSIESNVESASVYVKRGNENVSVRALANRMLVTWGNPLRYYTRAPNAILHTILPPPVTCACCCVVCCVQLRSAIASQKRTRKCYCCMLCIAIIIVCLLVAGLGSFFGGAFKKL